MNEISLYQRGRRSLLRPRVLVRLFTGALLWITMAACLAEAIR
ncbi:MAG: hypothetical protein AB7U81_11980 [Thiohalomonadaceae bacterium]